MNQHVSPKQMFKSIRLTLVLGSYKICQTTKGESRDNARSLDAPTELKLLQLYLNPNASPNNQT